MIRHVSACAISLAFLGTASATPRNVTLSPATGPALYEQRLPIQIVFVGFAPGTACPANPTFDPWTQRTVTAPCTATSDDFSALDIDEQLVRRMLPARVQPSLFRGPLAMAMAVPIRHRTIGAGSSDAGSCRRSGSSTIARTSFRSGST